MITIQSLISVLGYYYATQGSFEPDFVYDLRDTLTKVPMSLQDTQAASAVIRILGRELLYSPVATESIIRLGFRLCDVLSSIIPVRKLTNDEIQVVYSLAMRRLELSAGYSYLLFFISIYHNYSSNETLRESCRPWEVAIVGICASQHPTLEDVIQGRSGIPSLELALNELLATDIRDRDGHPNTMDEILQAICCLSNCEWVKDIASPGFISLMVDVLR